MASIIDPQPALYSADGETGWVDVEIIGMRRGGHPVLREVGKFYPGVFLAKRSQVALTLERGGVRFMHERRMA